MRFLILTLVIVTFQKDILVLGSVDRILGVFLKVVDKVVPPDQVAVIKVRESVLFASVSSLSNELFPSDIGQSSSAGRFRGTSGAPAFYAQIEEMGECALQLTNNLRRFSQEKVESMRPCLEHISKNASEQTVEKYMQAILPMSLKCKIGLGDIINNKEEKQKFRACMKVSQLLDRKLKSLKQMESACLTGDFSRSSDETFAIADRDGQIHGSVIR